MDYQQSWQGVSSQAPSRLQFVRSVYLWLMAGFGVALLAAFGAFVTVAAWAPVVQGSPGLFLVAMLIGLYGSTYLARRTAQMRPLNILTYALATAVFGFIAGMMSLAAASQSGMAVLVSAVGLAILAFLALTVVAFVSTKDFSFLAHFVIVGLVIGIGGSFIAYFFNLPMF